MVPSRQYASILHGREHQAKKQNIEVIKTLEDTPAVLFIQTFTYIPQKLFATGDIPGFISVSSFRDVDEGTFREVEPLDRRRALALLAYTSGTTGLPKAVEVTQHGYVTAICASEWVL